MNAQPDCYGSKQWDPNHVECKGGLDQGYENPIDGSKRRDPCRWLMPCGQIAMAERNRPQSTPQLLPAQSLVRPIAPPPPAPPPPRLPAPPTYTPPRPPFPVPQQAVPTPSYQPQATYPQPAPAAPVYQQPMQHMLVPPHVAQYGPAYVYPPYQMQGSQMPQYLTMPEPVQEDVHWAMRLGRELFRSVVKALGHSLAAHVDSNSIGRHNRQ